MSGAIATEYADQLIESATASRSPFAFAETDPPEPSTTSATPANETPAASQKRGASCSRPSACAKSAVKIGVVPRISATVVAVVNLSAYTKQIWFTKIATTAAAMVRRDSRPPILSVPSSANVNPAKTSAATP